MIHIINRIFLHDWKVHAHNVQGYLIFTALNISLELINS